MNAVYVGSDNLFSRTVATATQDSEHISVLTVNCMMMRTSNSSTALDVEYAEYVQINEMKHKDMRDNENDFHLKTTISGWGKRELFPLRQM